ncbi:MAG: putative metal-binding motif-containing protein [Pseudomonadota bacterium]
MIKHLPALFALLGLSACGGSWEVQDADGDGYSPIEGDCWDAVDGPGIGGLTGAAIHPGAVERWYDGFDQDCAGDDDYDADGDGYVPDAYQGLPTSNVEGSGSLPDGDCWDDPSGIPEAQRVVSSAFTDKDGTSLDWAQPAAVDTHPGATETWYDGADSNCDAASDFDQDGDGFTTDAFPTRSGAFGTDCIDGALIDPDNPAGIDPEDVNPEAVEEYYDGTDQDCDENDCDADGDGYDGDPDALGFCENDDCDDADPERFPNPAIPEVWYNGVDENCDNNDGDQDGDGYWIQDYEALVAAQGVAPLPVPDGMDGDCDDMRASTWPGAPDTWYDGIDSDCAGDNDFDQDRDTYLSDDYGGDDCDDVNAGVNPAAVETWYDGVDADCDGHSDYDADLDGFDTSAYGGRDCDDTDAAIKPGATEIWYDGVDQNCDGHSDYDQDRDSHDSDAYGGDDCNDLAASVHPGAGETWYDGIDADCAGDSDFDQDADGYDTNAYGGDDCNDVNAGVNPGAAEIWYDGIDENCDGLSDYDQDGDGYLYTGAGGLDCDDTLASAHPGATEVWYDGIDQDCDGGSDYDQDGDGYDSDLYGGTDCADTLGEVHPGAPDAWYDGIDADCDGASDYDQDADGYDSAAWGGDDCADTDAARSPGATEIWYDGVDQDCAGDDDYDQDADGDRAEAHGGTDCDDTDASVYPAAFDDASDNLVDNDCDGWVDEEAIDADSLLINEVNRMSDAGGTYGVTNRMANWFEIRNTESFDIALDNIAFRMCDEPATCGSTGGFTSQIPNWAECDSVSWFSVSPDAGLVIPAGGFAVFCQDDAVFGTATDCDYTWSDSSWTGESPEAIAHYTSAYPAFRDQNGMLGVWLDGVGLDDAGWAYKNCGYGTDWPIHMRYTMTLSGAASTAAENDVGTDWCECSGSAVWATVPVNSFGTPGTADPTCL